MNFDFDGNMGLTSQELGQQRTDNTIIVKPKYTARKEPGLNVTNYTNRKLTLNSNQLIKSRFLLSLK